MSNWVTVACKIPSGLELHHGGKSAVLRGSGHPEARFGFGFTSVEKDLFDAWAEAHKNQPYIKNELIFAYAREDSAVSASKERQGIKSDYLTGMNPENPMPGIQKAAA